CCRAALPLLISSSSLARYVGPQERGVLMTLFACLCCGLVLQGLYIHLFQRIPIGILILGTSVVYAASIGRDIISSEGKRILKRFGEPLAGLYLCILYGLFVAVFYRGTNILAFFEPFLYV